MYPTRQYQISVFHMFEQAYIFMNGSVSRRSLAQKIVYVMFGLVNASSHDPSLQTIQHQRLPYEAPNTSLMICSRNFWNRSFPSTMKYRCISRHVNPQACFSTQVRCIFLAVFLHFTLVSIRSYLKFSQKTFTLLWFSFV